LREGWWDAPLKISSLMPEENLSMIKPLAASPGPEEMPHRQKKLAMAKQLMTESGNDFTWVAARLGVNPTTLWRWRKAGKL